VCRLTTWQSILSAPEAACWQRWQAVPRTPPWLKCSPLQRPTAGQLHNRYLKMSISLQWLLDNPPDEDDPYSPQARTLCCVWKRPVQEPSKCPASRTARTQPEPPSCSCSAAASGTARRWRRRARTRVPLWRAPPPASLRRPPTSTSGDAPMAWVAPCRRRMQSIQGCLRRA
jgi:hypothetical protein